MAIFCHVYIATDSMEIDVVGVCVCDNFLIFASGRKPSLHATQTVSRFARVVCVVEIRWKVSRPHMCTRLCYALRCGTTSTTSYAL